MFSDLIGSFFYAINIIDVVFMKLLVCLDYPYLFILHNVRGVAHILGNILS